MSDGAARAVRVRPWRRPSLTTGVNLVVYAAVVLLNILQQPGRITFDTKLDLQLNPTDLLARSGDLWNGDWALGGLQNQASGYLFPMGPAFIVGEVLGVPMWVWQRLWSAAVMILAYEGARRLAARWPGIGTTGAVLAGLTYMLSPRVLTTVGGLSGETLPAAVLPWTVLPLVLFLRGRLRGWVAFVLSAATVPLMGGQNATLVVACLVLPALLLALASGRSLRQRFAHLAALGCARGGGVAVVGRPAAAPRLLRAALPRLHRVGPEHRRRHRLAVVAARHEPLGGVLPRWRPGRVGRWLRAGVVAAAPAAHRPGGRGRPGRVDAEGPVGTARARVGAPRRPRGADRRKRGMGGLGVRRRVAPRPRHLPGAAAQHPQVRPRREAAAEPGGGRLRDLGAAPGLEEDEHVARGPGPQHRGGRGRRAGARRRRPGGRGLAAHQGRLRRRTDAVARRGRVPRRPARAHPDDRAPRRWVRRADLGTHDRRADPGPGPGAVDGARAGHRRARRDPPPPRLGRAGSRGPTTPDVTSPAALRTPWAPPTSSSATTWTPTRSTHPTTPSCGRPSPTSPVPRWSPPSAPRPTATPPSRSTSSPHDAEPRVEVQDWERPRSGRRGTGGASPTCVPRAWWRGTRRWCWPPGTSNPTWSPTACVAWSAASDGCTTPARAS